MKSALIVFCLFGIVPFIAGQCTLRVSLDLPAVEPLFLVSGTRNYVRADTSGNIRFNAGQTVLLACPGTTLTVTGGSEATATCVGGVQFSIGGSTYNANQLGCARWPTSTHISSGTCLNGKTNVKIGYQVSTGLVELIEACHDTSLHHTYYTKFIMTTEANAFRTGIARPDWVNGHLFVGLNPTNLYTRATQRQTIGTILGSAALGEQYISLTTDYFLSKGHLTAKADFFFGTQQMVTFYYSNAAPQWQTFNGANWNTLEDNVRAFTSRLGSNLEVYTGTYGRATLGHANGNQADLYLTTNAKMPVPRMFWKILYNPATQAGIAFIGLNNPYQTAAQAAADVRCTDISSTVSWLTWSQFDLVKGYSYTCEVNNFRANFPDIPSFTVNSILR